MKGNAQKMQETMRQKRGEFAAQTIQLDKDWRIIRLDERNWELQYKGQFRGYFGRLVNALQDAPHKMLSKEANGGIAELLSIMRRIEETVERAVRIHALVDS